MVKIFFDLKNITGKPIFLVSFSSIFAFKQAKEQTLFKDANLKNDK